MKDLRTSLLILYVCLLSALVLLCNACKPILSSSSPTPSSAPQTVPLEKSENHAPTIKTIVTDKYITPSSKINLHCVANDADEDKLFFSWSADGGTFSGEGADIIWNTPSQTGNYKITVTAADGKGGQVTYAMPITVNILSGINRPPSISLTATPKGDPRITSSSPANPIRIRQWDVVDIECTAEDPDGDPITLTWWASEGRLKEEGTRAIFVPTERGDQVVTVIARDAGGRQTTGIVYFHIQCCGGK